MAFSSNLESNQCINISKFPYDNRKLNLMNIIQGANKIFSSVENGGHSLGSFLRLGKRDSMFLWKPLRHFSSPNMAEDCFDI